MQQLPSSGRARPLVLLAAGTATLIATVIGANLVLLNDLRQSSLQTADLVLSAACAIVVLIAACVIALWWRERERARLAAEAAYRTKSSFLAMMSHEIRTPLNAVLGLTTTLLDTKLDAEQRKALVAIHGAGDNLLHILNDILDFSKLESGPLSLETVAFSPVMLVRAAVSVVEPRAAAKGLAIETIEDPSLPAALMGDVGRIRQVVLNLVSNAIKFTADGKITISVHCRERDDTNAQVEWSVSDTGIGIAPARIKELFNEFVQADDSIHRRFGGSGLGLAICKRLVEQMGGEIGVTSALGQGSTFRFALTLPLARQEALSERDDHELYAEFKTSIAALGRPLRILIVDDNSTNRLVAAQMLKDFDVQANMACDGAEAVVAATSFPYDVILMDVRMPEMDGLQATRAIRARGGRLASVPIVAFTANAFAEDVQACLDAGMDDCLIKPVRKKMLVETILRLTADGSADDAANRSDIVSPPITPDASPPGAPVEIVPADRVPVLDHGAYETLAREIGEASASELFDLFVEETLERLELLRRLADMSDRPLIEREAHSLKGTAATFGFSLLSQLGRGLQLDAERIDADAYAVLLGRIEQAFTSARAEMATRFGKAA
jgi:signal transduction histidine kinase/DNA-binding NarL/FixJ family response regulator/HPt (histidine-containing phosphotransfer) domain-containing protein